MKSAKHILFFILFIISVRTFFHDTLDCCINLEITDVNIDLENSDNHAIELFFNNSLSKRPAKAETIFVQNITPENDLLFVGPVMDHIAPPPRS